MVSKLVAVTRQGSSAKSIEANIKVGNEEQFIKIMVPC